MSKIILSEGNLQFEFVGYNSAISFDNRKTNLHGLEPVDFVAESNESLCFIEVKDYQHPHHLAYKKRKENCKILIDVATEKGETASIFCHKMGSKFKDSLLRKCASGDISKGFQKEIVYLLFINFDIFGETERGLLKAKISNHVPKGQTSNRRGLFPRISFELVNADQLKAYGIICTPKNYKEA